MISGPPGAGKTTIARPLARALGLPLFAKDSIKERMHDVLAQAGPLEPAWSRRLGAASMELLWLLAAEAPACVLEANFWNGHEGQNVALAQLSHGGVLVEVFCTAPREEVIRRFRARQASGARHAVHTGHEFAPEFWDNSSRPIGLGHVIEVDTTTPVDVGLLASAVRSALEGGIGCRR